LVWIEGREAGGGNEDFTLTSCNCFTLCANSIEGKGERLTEQNVTEGRGRGMKKGGSCSPYVYILVRGIEWNERE